MIRMFVTRWMQGAVLLGLFGCVETTLIDTRPLESAPYEVPIEGTPSAVGVLALVNDSHMTFERLSVELGLQIPVVNDIVDFRNGNDGFQGTEDDLQFVSLSELLALSSVEESTLTELVEYAHRLGFVPEGTDVLGTWDEQVFTVDQADVVLHVINGATFEALDQDVPLDVRAAEAIMETRPIMSVQLLSEIPYVGAKAMNQVFQYAGEQHPGWVPPKPCRPVILPRDDVNASALDILIQGANQNSERDASLWSFGVQGCNRVLDDTYREHLLAKTLWMELMEAEWSDKHRLSRSTTVSEWRVGGEGFTDALTNAIHDVEAFYGDQAGGGTTPYERVLYEMRGAVRDELLDGVQERPEAFIEVSFEYEHAGCFERADNLVDLQTGLTVTVYEQEGCQ